MNKDRSSRLMHLALFDTRPVGLSDGFMIVAVGVALSAALEIEKSIRCRLGLALPGDGIRHDQ